MGVRESPGEISLALELRKSAWGFRPGWKGRLQCLVLSAEDVRGAFCWHTGWA